MLYLKNNCFAVFLTHSLKSGYENSSFALFLANSLKSGYVGRKFIYFSLEMQERKSHITFLASKIRCLTCFYWSYFPLRCTKGPISCKVQ